jgi:flagellar motor switch protein FliN
MAAELGLSRSPAPGAPACFTRVGRLGSAQGKPPDSEPAKTAVPAQDKLDLLMDVELDVSLRFGKRTMLLREILELDAGSVVELDRQVQEPANLLLDGKLVARGKVVIMDGNYGLRVLEIISPQP